MAGKDIEHEVAQRQSPSVIQSLASNEKQRVVSIGIDLIRPGSLQARTVFPEEGLSALAESIKTSGIIQPLVVKEIEGHYELLAGERRWRAAQRAGLHVVPVIIRNDIDEEEAFILGLAENIQRESLTPLDEASGLSRMCNDYKLTHAEAAQRIGKSRAYVSHMIRLLSLCSTAREALASDTISLGHAKVLVGLDAGKQIHFCKQSIEQGWSVRQLEAAIARSTVKVQLSPPKDPNQARLERRLSDHLGSRVAIDGDTQKGVISIPYSSLEVLQGILEKIDSTLATDN